MTSVMFFVSMETGAAVANSVVSNASAQTAILFMIYKIVKDDGTKINKLWYFLSFCMLIISPFFLAISERTLEYHEITLDDC